VLQETERFIQGQLAGLKRKENPWLGIPTSCIKLPFIAYIFPRTNGDQFNYHLYYNNLIIQIYFQLLATDKAYLKNLNNIALKHLEIY